MRGNVAQSGRTRDHEALGHVVSGNCSPAAVAAGHGALRSECLHGYPGGHSLLVSHGSWPLPLSCICAQAVQAECWDLLSEDECPRVYLSPACHWAACPGTGAQGHFLEVGPKSQDPLSQC